MVLGLVMFGRRGSSSVPFSTSKFRSSQKIETFKMLPHLWIELRCGPPDSPLRLAIPSWMTGEDRDTSATENFEEKMLSSGHKPRAMKESEREQVLHEVGQGFSRLDSVEMGSSSRVHRDLAATAVTQEQDVQAMSGTAGLTQSQFWLSLGIRGGGWQYTCIYIIRLYMFFKGQPTRTCIFIYYLHFSFHIVLAMLLPRYAVTKPPVLPPQAFFPTGAAAPSEVRGQRPLPNKTFLFFVSAGWIS